MKRKINVLLADDHAVVRMGLAAIIGLEDDLTVVGEAGNGEEAVRLAKMLRPDVVVMDLMMPRVNGAEATRAIRAENPDAAILILTTFGGSEDVKRALDAGACGALVKDSTHAEIIRAIRETAAGKRIVSPEIERQLASAPKRPALAPRHAEILALVAKGLTNQEIACVLGIGPDCVKAHLKAAFVRIGASSRSEAVALALANGLIPA